MDHEIINSFGELLRRYRRAVVCTAALMLSATPVAGDKTGDAGHALEYRVKAAFLYNFARFVEWPPGDTRSESRLVIGILGKDPFGSVLDDTVRGKTAAGRPLEIRRLTSVDAAASCHVIFVSSSERGRLKQLLPALNDSAVLTVGETPNFLDHGGMVNFVIEKQRVRIDLNLETARSAGLRISSQLIGVARKVRDT